MTRDTDPGPDGAMNMGGLAHLGMTTTGGTIGPGRNYPLKIILAPPLLVTFFTVKGSRRGMNKETLKT